MPRAKLAKVSVEDLKKEISRRQKGLLKLIAKRDALNSQIAELEALGLPVKPVVARRRKKLGRKRGRKAQRMPRAGSLASALVEALKAKGKQSVAELVAAVQEAGYKSKSKNFQTIVGMALSKGKQFKRVKRGVYKLKG
jgi:chorismate mutase